MITENRHNEFGCLMAMVEPTRSPHIKEGMSLSVPVTRFKYSGQDGKKLYINL